MEKRLVLTFDCEEFDTPRQFGCEIAEDEMYRVTRSGLGRLTQLLDSKKVVATFFTTARFCRHSPDLLKGLKEKGHEIALHGYAHHHNYNRMERGEAFKHLKKAKEEVEGMLDTTLLGFRAPNLRYPPYALLRDLDLRYDSSYHPTYVPGRYNNFFGPRRPFHRDGIWVIPVSTTPLLRLPFTWTWFRNFGLRYAELCTVLALLDMDYVNIYFHPWDFVDISGYAIPRHLVKNTGAWLEEGLGRYIDWCVDRGLKPSTLAGLLEALEG